MSCARVLRVSRGQQSLQRYLGMFPVAEMPIAVSEGVPCRLDHQVQVCRRVMFEAGEIELVENTQRFQIGYGTARRSHTGDAVAAKILPKRHAENGLIVRQILAR